MLTLTQLDYLGELIKTHKKLYPKLSVKAEQFESLFASVTNAMWTPNNHNNGEDMLTEIDGLNKPSLKSGIIENDYLTISSHRTTKYKTLSEKIDFLKSREYDSYICLSRPDKNKPHKYYLIYFSKSTIDYDSLKWINTYNKIGDHSGWYGESHDKKIQVSIIKSMSDQVWVTLDITKIKILREYDFTE